MQKVLIVEDDEVTRRVIAKAVQGMGYIPLQASSGERGLNVLQDNGDIALLITDLMMPQMSGQELVKIIRGNTSWDKIPILMISGVVALNEIVKILELGATRFLPKPLVIENLREDISILLGAK